MIRQEFVFGRSESVNEQFVSVTAEYNNQCVRCVVQNERGKVYELRVEKVVINAKLTLTLNLLPE